MARAKVKPQVGVETTTAPRRAVPKLADDPATAAPAAEKFDWRTDPSLRAFACLLSFETGWMTEPADVAWLFDEARKVVVVQRPVGSTTLFSQTEAPVSMGAPQAILEVQKRWGDVVRAKVEGYAFPRAPDAQPENERLDPAARFLRTVARSCVANGATEERIETALIEVVRHCISLVRMANVNDNSASAAFTRQVAAALITDLISPVRVGAG